VKGTGDIPDEEISSNIDKFQTRDDVKVFVGTWQKCGTGFTLNAANYMIFIDTPWTDGAFQQASDRIHRIGSKRPVFIYNLICSGTVDEKVLEIVQDKAALSDFIVDNEISQKSLLSLQKYIEELR
jgi:SNF2 family DNA or RNA helicase